MGSYFETAIEILKIFKKNNYQAYIVGGFVRDYLIFNKDLKYLNNDIDITTNCLPNEVFKLFENVYPTGIEFGTVTIKYNDFIYEITTFRNEGIYKDGRHPIYVSFTDDITKDLKRRDFTINSLLIDENKNILDYLKLGIIDLNKKNIRCIGNCDERFQEDALRIIRGIYFSLKLDFNLDYQTKESILKNYELLKNLKKERIHKELEKIFNLKVDKLKILSILKEYNISKALGLDKIIDFLIDKNIEELDLEKFLSIDYYINNNYNNYFVYTKELKNKIELIKQYINNKAFSNSDIKLFFLINRKSMLYLNSVKKILKLDYFKNNEIDSKYNNIEVIQNYLREINFNLNLHIKDLKKEDIRDFKISLLTSLLNDFENNIKLDIFKHIKKIKKGE